jgi:hypothetical protein
MKLGLVTEKRGPSGTSPGILRHAGILELLLKTLETVAKHVVHGLTKTF